MAKTKKVRCTCVKCQKVNYLPASSIDTSEEFLCEPCDDKFIVFQNTPGRMDASLDAFLRRSK